jgi:bifunctional non-homologous end joining protein LigD
VICRQFRGNTRQSAWAGFLICRPHRSRTSSPIIPGVDGISDFNALHSGKHSEEVQLCAFDVLAMDGDDLRRLPLTMRKANLARLRGRPEGIFLNPFEQGEIGPDLFLKACEFGLEGLVSKHRDRPYQSGRSKHWIKIKNRKHEAFDWVQEAHRRT